MHGYGLQDLKMIDNKWKFSGKPRVDIISNSWGVSNFPSFKSAPGMDVFH